MARIVLHDADLHGIILIGANLRKAILHATDLRGTSLENANLSGAWLSGTDLENANLENANLSGAWLSWAMNLTAGQVQSAENWHEAHLPDHLQYLLEEPPA